MSFRERLEEILEGEKETLVIFPTFGSINTQTDRVSIPIHAWVFEWETASRSRRVIVEALKKIIKVSDDSPEHDVFLRRVAPFLVDNERGQTLAATIDGTEHIIGTTSADGQVRGELVLPLSTVESAFEETNGRRFLPIVFKNDTLEVTQEIPIVGNEGVSVISDIDDTIKLTGVLDHTEMLKNTFLRPFKAVPTVAEKYQDLAAQGAEFHYVSASPWQLLPFLQEFLSRAGFPDGTFHLRTLRVKSLSSPLEFIKSSRDYKTKTITDIIGTFPQRRFILVGDSGEGDPEVYGDIARLFPDQIEEIWIRLVEGATNGTERFEAAFNNLKNDLWKTDWLDD